MITYKTWDDFFEDRTCSTRPVVAYGAGWMCQSLMAQSIIDPDYICDKKAYSIKRIIHPISRTPIVVLGLEEMRELGGVIDLFVTIDFQAWPKNVEDEFKIEMQSVFGGPNLDLKCYMQKEDDAGVIQTPAKALYYRGISESNSAIPQSKVREVNDRLKKEYGISLSMRVISDSLVAMQDSTNPQMTITAGRRCTAGQPAQWRSRIHIFGDSRVIGYEYDNEAIFCSILQMQLNENNMPYKVLNYGIAHPNMARVKFQISNACIGKGDIAIIVTHFYHEADLSQHQMVEIKQIEQCSLYCRGIGAKLVCFNLPFFSDITSHKVYCSTISKLEIECQKRDTQYHDLFKHFDDAGLFNEDVPDHLSKQGHRLMAKTLFNLITQLEREDNENDLMMQVEAEDAKFKEIIRDRLEKNGTLQYVTELKGKYKKADVENAGAIVMNCNPFTMGHRYLIEWAARQVECLYVLVVEEDRSVFSFKDRFRLVKENTQDIENVVVVPSGEFVISSVTFPEYFSKESLRETKINAGEDLLMFAGVIAPALDIKTRFVGQEPFDPVTRQYNEQMQNILPDHGIEVVEIPRKCLEGQAISASRVRKLLGESKWDEIKQLVPETTYRYLREREGTRKGI